MLNGPFSPWPDFDEEEQAAVLKVISSNRVNYWTGQEGREFEREFAEFCDASYAVAVTNGTVALDLAWQALSLPKGSEVIVTPRTFLASISSIVLSGLVPVFADIDRNTQNISPQTVADKITPNTSAILCVHLAGWPVDMDGMKELAVKHELKLVEDCAQAHGAKYKGQPVGSIGDIAAWSFCQDKIMTTAGEGGMVTTNNKALWHKVWSFKDHGKSYEAVYERQHPPGFRWLHESFGTNWRMPEMQSAVGRLQVKKMPRWRQTRWQYASQIFDTANQLSGLRVPKVPEDIEHAAYKCYVFVEPEKLAEGWDRDKIMSEINALGVPCFSGSCSEVYLEKAFENTGFRPTERLSVAKELGETSLMFLVHPTLKPEEIEKTCKAIKTVMEQATA